MKAGRETTFYCLTVISFVHNKSWTPLKPFLYQLCILPFMGHKRDFRCFMQKNTDNRLPTNFKKITYGMAIAFE